MNDETERTFYELLGVEPSATTEEIKEAYREIARIFHPDSNFYSDIIDDDGPSDSDLFKAITQAYQVLIHEEKRKEYDELLNGYSPDAWSEGEDGEYDDEDIPEEWRKEREFFEQHFEEILRPAPKVNLVGKDGEEQVADEEDTSQRDAGRAPNSTAFEGEIVSKIKISRFGRPASDDDPFSTSHMLYARRVPRPSIDIIDLISYVGIPALLLIVIVEVIYLYS